MSIIKTYIHITCFENNRAFKFESTISSKSLILNTKHIKKPSFPNQKSNLNNHDDFPINPQHKHVTKPSINTTPTAKIEVKVEHTHRQTNQLTTAQLMQELA